MEHHRPVRAEVTAMPGEPQFSYAPDPDKLTEKQMAERLGTTVKALQSRRSRNQIPEGVWNKFGHHIMYSVRRYDEWLESLWVCPPGWKSEATQSASVLVGRVSVDQKHSRFPPRKRGSRLPPALEIK